MSFILLNSFHNDEQQQTLYLMDSLFCSHADKTTGVFEVSGAV